MTYLLERQVERLEDGPARSVKSRLLGLIAREG